MIAPIINEAPKIGRNDPCPCGSKKKYKYCCGEGNGKALAPTAPSKVLSQQGLNRCFLKLVKDAGGSIEIACEDLDGMPKEEMLAIKYDSEKDSFSFGVIMVEKSKIIRLGKRGAMPGVGEA